MGSGDSYIELHKGRKPASVYYWVNPNTGGVLYHTEVNDEVIPFFSDIGSAETYLEQEAETNGPDQYEQYSLYDSKTRKVVDAVDVLTDQAGIEDFFPAED